jgi:cysteinyl-tRNA synthetase
LNEAKNAVNGFYDLFTRLRESEDRSTADKGLMSAIEERKVAFRDAMDDDFNTSMAIAVLQRLKSEVNELLSQGLSTAARMIAREEFRSFGNNLGLFQLERWQFKRNIAIKAEPGSYQISGKEIDLKVAERNEARKQKDFKKADEIRQFLASHGIVIEDKPDGTSRWKR